ncbi:hypothetical protein J6590_006179 [Homalodisca vitripennis]|nr:hypothetical protein J6590_006179 [Homalodisca vitripennis]
MVGYRSGCPTLKRDDPMTSARDNDLSGCPTLKRDDPMTSARDNDLSVTVGQ